jgi:ribosomal protein L1
MISSACHSLSVFGCKNAATIFRVRAFSSVAVQTLKGPNPRRHNMKTSQTTTTSSLLNAHQAVDAMKSSAWAKFDETVEISINTGLDPRKPNQSVKGVAKLPSGTGKKIRICVIASASDANAALEAGADVAGAEEVIAALQGGDLSFNTVIATPEMMPMISKIGRVSNKYNYYCYF